MRRSLRLLAFAVLLAGPTVGKADIPPAPPRQTPPTKTEPTAKQGGCARREITGTPGDWLIPAAVLFAGLVTWRLRRKTDA